MASSTFFVLDAGSSCFHKYAQQATKVQECDAITAEYCINDDPIIIIFAALCQKRKKDH
jgi:hypothetical protein